jgi:hypothetical protein
MRRGVGRDDVEGGAKDLVLAVEREKVQRPGSSSPRCRTGRRRFRARRPAPSFPSFAAPAPRAASADVRRHAGSGPGRSPASVYSRPKPMPRTAGRDGAGRRIATGASGTWIQPNSVSGASIRPPSAVAQKSPCSSATTAAVSRWRRRGHRRRYGGVLGEVLGEHRHQLARLRVIGGGSAQVRRGSSSSGSTPGTATGTSKPKFGSLRNSPALSEPSSAAVSSARVALIGIRCRCRRRRRSSRC